MLKANRLFLLLLLLLSFTLAGCKGEIKENVTEETNDDAVGESLKNHGQGKRFYENEPRWVTAQGGLKMRKTFSLNSEVILLIPEGEMVTINAELPNEEEVAGVKGKWSRVEYLRETGWVFGGFLTAEDPEQEGIVDESLLIGAWYGTLNDDHGENEIIDFIIIKNNFDFERYNYDNGKTTGKWRLQNRNLIINFDNDNLTKIITNLEPKTLKIKVFFGGTYEFNGEYTKVPDGEIEKYKAQMLGK